MSTKLTVVVDNTAAQGLPGEWGLCLDIVHEGHHLLVDTGATDLFLRNMQALGLDVGTVECGVLSHAHYDHAGGMAAFFEHNDHAAFYLRQGAAENCYSRGRIFHRYIGIPKGVLNTYQPRIRFVEGDWAILPNAVLIGHKTPSEHRRAIAGREQMSLRRGLRFVADDFSHEQSLVLRTASGLVIVNSCCHGGVAQIIADVEQAFPDQPVAAVIGGFHLYNKTDDEIRAVAAALAKTSVACVCTGHCTMAHAAELLKRDLGDRLIAMHVGMELSF